MYIGNDYHLHFPVYIDIYNIINVNYGSKYSSSSFMHAFTYDGHGLISLSS
jgi:hypothetical protein